ncbi:hypothetical protein PC116_g11373 [Phytophthora cactorum]|uniref:Uncharacterized protein n=1 Tax=Phytophthora cactorum TaxID=29920 RepID=A0A8T1KWR1_9STRA|nr:hypothetical protein PC117_g21890 [Phytophthora cactorum]KAG3193395.1 hypothetical protein PC128_g10177 [Phytophthora cactorum]KAG4041156.1 hypothetical protein PC123_g23328 [Phytophthora cactorum]KAG4240649.1 hypothetical protein PC116_g11373 [Phytophthora cactorum]
MPELEIAEWWLCGLSLELPKRFFFGFSPTAFGWIGALHARVDTGVAHTLE